MSRTLWRAGVGLALAAILVSFGQSSWRALAGGVAGSEAVSQDARCLPGTPIAVLDSPHISWEAGASAQYNSTPPTSGPHFGFTLATGVYDTSVPDGLTVHALEHGHVAVQYALDTPPEVIGQLKSLAKRHGDQVVLAPYPGLTTGIALTAWGRLDHLDKFDEARVQAFIEAFAGRYAHGWTKADPC